MLSAFESSSFFINWLYTYSCSSLDINVFWKASNNYLILYFDSHFLIDTNYKTGSILPSYTQERFWYQFITIFCNIRNNFTLYISFQLCIHHYSALKIAILIRILLCFFFLQILRLIALSVFVKSDEVMHVLISLFQILY